MNSAEIFDQAIARHKDGRLDEALVLFNALLKQHPDVAPVQSARADVLMAAARFAEAAAGFEAALRLKPDDARLHVKKGAALQLLGRAGEALVSYDRAAALDPGNADAPYNRGTALSSLGRLEEALAGYDAALVLRPGDAKARNNKGLALRDLKRLEEALVCFDAPAGPQHQDMLCNKGMCHLLLGRFETGWPLYEARKYRAKPVALPALERPLWSGEQSLQGKTLLLHAEQGLGDTLQFCRYVRLAEARGANVILSVPRALMRLLADSGMTVVDAQGPMPACDYHNLLLSMPQAFKSAAATIPADVPYLRAESARVQNWSQKIGGRGFKIGIAWQGDKSVAIDAGRSIPLRHFAALGKIPGVRLISLQKHDGVEQLADLPPGMEVETLGADFDTGPDAFLDTAAVMENLDLIITSDTAIAHLAGALGRPVWVALQHVPEWRWLLDRDDSPWYPGMRLFRQPARGDWAALFQQMQSALKTVLYTE